MVKKDSKGIIGEKQKPSFLNIITALVKKHPYYAIGGAVLTLILLVLLTGLFHRNQDANDGFQTVAVERGDLIAVVGATGVVEPNQTVDLSWETTGRVESVYVAVNDVVEEGSLLAELADNTLPQSVILAQADLVVAQKALDDLVNSNTESAIAYSALLDAEQELRDAEDERDEWNYNEADIDRVYAARSDFLDLEEEYKDAKLAYAKVKNLNDDDPKKNAAKELLDESKLKRDKALRTLNYILGKSYDQQVAEDFADYDVALARLEDAQREWNRVKDGPNVDDIIAAKAKVAAAEAVVSLGKVEAPFGGTITRAFPKVGDEVSAGIEAFRIDDLSTLFVEVEISEVDINRIAIGQKADLSFDAIIGEMFTGEVVEVSSVGIDNGSGVDFLVKLKIIDPTDQVRPGMTAAVNIIVSEINNVLTIPNRAVRMKEGKRVIYLLKDGTLEEVEVVLGASSDIKSELLSGHVKAGDLIVLNPPMEFSPSNGRPPFMRQ